MARAEGESVVAQAAAQAPEHAPGRGVAGPSPAALENRHKLAMQAAGAPFEDAGAFSTSGPQAALCGFDAVAGITGQRTAPAEDL